MKPSIFYTIVCSLLFCLFGFPKPLLAKQCNPAPFEESTNVAEIIFEGTVIEREPYEPSSKKSACWERGTSNNELCGGKLATFKIEHLWKGDFTDKTIQAYSEDACYCLGNYFEEGKKYIVFAYKNRSSADWKKLFVNAGNVCQGSIPSHDSYAPATELRQKLHETFKK